MLVTAVLASSIRNVTSRSLEGFLADLDSDAGEVWLAVIGRALAFLCLHAADLRGKDVGEQAALLESLGLSNDDIAPLIGSTANSVRVLLQQRRKRTKGGRRASKTGKKKRR